MKTTPDYYRIYYNRYKDKYEARYKQKKQEQILFREDGELIDACYYLNYYKDWINKEKNAAEQKVFCDYNTNAAEIQYAKEVFNEPQRKTT